MKLYTEEQVKEAIRLANLSTNVFTTPVMYSKQEVLEQLIPIELPSDDEMGKILEPHSDEYAAGYYGAINMIEEKILNQNK